MKIQKRIGVAILAVLAAAACHAASPADANAQVQSNSLGDSFTLQWSEDFTTETAFNSKRWNVWFNGKTPTMDKTFGMKIAPGGFIGTSLASTPHDINGNVGNTDPAKAYLGTTLFGRYTARMYTDPSDTQNQAFWLVKPVFTHDDWNEIDLEIFQSAYVRPGTVIPTFSPHFGDWQPFHMDPAPRDASVVVPRGWHTWTIDWTPNYIAWHCDGELRNIRYNNSWRPEWTELSGSGVEAQLFPQALMFSQMGAGGKGGSGDMSVSAASYAALQMQSFPAADFIKHSGGTVATDDKTILGAPGTGNKYVGSLKPGDYLCYKAVETKWRNISIQVDSAQAGRKIQIHSGSPTGPVIGTIDIPVTRGPEWVYNDLLIQSDPKQVASRTRKFATCNSSQEVGKTLTIAGGEGFTPGTYTIKAITVVKDPTIHALATLDREAGKPISTGGLALLHYQNPIRYTLVSSDLTARQGPPQDIYLTFSGGDAGFSLCNIYFFGTQPSSRIQ